MKVLSETTGIPFSDDVDQWYTSLESSVKSYERTFSWAVHINPRAREAFVDMPGIIDLKGLQPSAKLENLIRDRLTKPLQKSQWLQDCKEYNIKERFSGVPREELEEMLCQVGKEARKRVLSILDANELAGASALRAT